MSRSRQTLLASVVVVVVYVALARGSLAAAIVHGTASAVWPPSGLAVAIVLLGGPRFLPAIALGAWLVTSATGVSTPVATGIAVGNTLEAALGALLLRRARFDPDVGSLRDVALLAGLAAVLSTAASTGIGVGSLWAGGYVPAADLVYVVVTWWLGNAMGILVLTPLLTAWSSPPRGWSRGRSAELLLFAGVSAALGYLAFGSTLVPVATPLGFAVFPLMLWGAVRLGVHGTTLSSVLLSAFAAWGTVSGRGPFAREHLPTALTLLQAFMSIVSLSGLSLAAVLSQERKAEAALRRSEAQFRALVQQAFDAVIVVGADGRIRAVNTRACESLGRAEADLVGRPFAAAGLSVPAPTEPPGGAPRTLEGTASRPDGHSFPVEVRIGGLDLAGEPVHVALVRDISERRRAEEEHARLSEQLRQAQKMEAVGTLAGGVAHDFNNLLTGIVGNIEIAALGLPEGSPARARLKSATTAADLAARLVLQLLAFSRRQPPRAGRARTDVDETVKLAEELLRRTLGPGVHVHLDLGDAGAVLVEVDALQQVLINLAVNARDAMPEGGDLTLATAAVVLTAEDAARHADARPGRFVRIEVRDTGEGMTPEVLQHVFEPFFTTKEVGKGTGLGLAVVYGIVQQHAGWIEVDTAPGVGTTFRVWLPRVDPETVTAPARAGTDVLPGGSETVLVVDDNALARDVARTVLEEGGYTVVEAEDGMSALAVVDTGRAVDLVLLDLTMPGMSGRETLRHLLERIPTMRVVIASGYSLDGGPEAARGWGARSFLAKPYGRADLRRVVRTVLDA